MKAQNHWCLQSVVQLFFLEVQLGDPHLVHSSEWPLTARCKVLQHFKFYIAEEKALHQRSLTPRSHFGRRQLQALASNLQLCRNCGRVMLSCLKTIPLRRFQSCQHHSRTKVSKVVFSSKISPSKLHYSPITSNLLSHAWSIKYSK